MTIIVTRTSEELSAEKKKARADRQRKWDAENYASVTCRVPVRVGRLFREYCEKRHTTPYAALRSFVYGCAAMQGTDEDRARMNEVEANARVLPVELMTPDANALARWSKETGEPWWEELSAHVRARDWYGEFGRNRNEK